MTARNRLPNRRPAEHFSFRCNGLAYTASIGRFPDGRLAEIFVSNSKAGSHSDAAAKDAAVVCSIATLVTGDDGRVQYYPVMSFDTLEVADAFIRAVIAAVLEHSPRAFDEYADTAAPEHSDNPF